MGLTWQALQAAAALASVVALVLLAGLVARRHGPGASRELNQSSLRLRATLALDSRRRLHLVETPSGPILALTGGTLDALITLTHPAAAPPQAGPS